MTRRRRLVQALAIGSAGLLLAVACGTRVHASWGRSGHGADGCDESDEAMCGRYGVECGRLTAENACGDARAIESCGECASTERCESNGACRCSPQSPDELCASAGARCGRMTVQDRCGTTRVVECGRCPAGLLCTGANHCVEQLCGDPAVGALFELCTGATDFWDCSLGKGTWDIGGGPSGDPGRCLCRTGQRSCSCSSRADCLGECIADVPVSGDCGAVDSGTCAAQEPMLGCWCRLRPEGWMRICVE